MQLDNNREPNNNREPGGDCLDRLRECHKKCNSKSEKVKVTPGYLATSNRLAKQKRRKRIEENKRRKNIIFIENVWK